MCGQFYLKLGLTFGASFFGLHFQAFNFCRLGINARQALLALLGNQPAKCYPRILSLFSIGIGNEFLVAAGKAARAAG